MYLQQWYDTRDKLNMQSARGAVNGNFHTAVGVKIGMIFDESQKNYLNMLRSYPLNLIQVILAKESAEAPAGLAQPNHGRFFYVSNKFKYQKACRMCGVYSTGYFAQPNYFV